MSKYIVFKKENEFKLASPVGDEAAIKAEALKLAPDGEFLIVNEESLPDVTFKKAWVIQGEGEDASLVVDINLARTLVAHPLRRIKRSEAFKPIDGDLVFVNLTDEGESIRASIKKEDDALQVAIDKTSNCEALKDVMSKAGLI